MILVSHDMVLAERIPLKVVMEDGRIVDRS